MEKLESIQNTHTTEKAQEFSLQLNQQIALENIQNLRMVVENIANYFDKALLVTHTDREEYIKKIENYENYLGEKYRDTAQERSYIKVVKEAIVYLKNL